MAVKVKQHKGAWWIFFGHHLPLRCLTFTAILTSCVIYFRLDNPVYSESYHFTRAVFIPVSGLRKRRGGRGMWRKLRQKDQWRTFAMFFVAYVIIALAYLSKLLD